MTACLQLDDVVVTAGTTTLLDRVCIGVERGRIVAVVGANGAGKTTMLDAICGVVPVTSGVITLAGRVARFRSGRACDGVARAFQGAPLPETLTVDEVVTLVCDDRERADELLTRFNLVPYADAFVAELSTGMRRILDLAVTTVGDPDVVLLDEPGAGLAASEVDRLADIIVRWRDETGAAVLIVEHDPTLLRRVADEVVMLDMGRVVARGPIDELLDGHGTARPRVADAGHAAFRSALSSVSEVAVPAHPPLRRSVSTWTLLRLGLREFAGGLISVLILGVLNRVMKVELGINLAVIAVVLASYNFAAPLAMAIGHRSDTRPILGRRRAPYIIGATALSSLVLVLAPHLAGRLADGITVPLVFAGFALFIVLGIGTYGSGAVFFALLADVVPERERGHAVSIVYFELILGVMAGVALSGSVLDGEAGGLTTLFAIAAVVVLAVTTFAVWGMEPRRADEEVRVTEHVPVLTATRRILSIPTARRFFVFMTLATVFLFLQQAVLEPYGGDVLGLDVRATNAFNAVQMAGVMIAMLLGGRGVIDRLGHKRVAGIGLVAGVVAFGALALAALTAAAAPSWFAILAVGVATGLFSVAGLALMVNMADVRHTALFMGFWTIAHAVADGVSTAGGGVIFESARWLAGSDPGAYATVFAVEAVGLALCIPLLNSIEVQGFRDEAVGVIDATTGPATVTDVGTAPQTVAR